MNKGPQEPGDPGGERSRDVVEIRCVGGCGRLIHRTSRGAVDPRKLEVRCLKCGKSLRMADWQVVMGEVPVTILIYRCNGCNVTYEKVFYGFQMRCKGCKISRTVFHAANGDPPRMIEGCGAS